MLFLANDHITASIRWRMQDGDPAVRCSSMSAWTIAMLERSRVAFTAPDPAMRKARRAAALSSRRFVTTLQVFRPDHKDRPRGRKQQHAEGLTLGRGLTEGNKFTAWGKAIESGFGTRPANRIERHRQPQLAGGRLLVPAPALARPSSGKSRSLFRCGADAQWMRLDNCLKGLFNRCAHVTAAPEFASPPRSRVGR